MELVQAPAPPERQTSLPERHLGRLPSRKQSMRLYSGDILVCDICLEPYDEQTRTAKFLTCHHSFCEVCLRKVAAAAGSGDVPLSIECPTCRRVTLLCAQGVAALQTNFYINSMKETMVKISGRGGSGNSMVAGVGCKKHFDQPLSFFCQLCEEMICRDCTVLEHRERDDHVIQDVATASVQRREALLVATADARTILGSAEAATAVLVTQLTGLHHARDAAVATVDAAFAGYSAELDARRKLIAARVVELHAERAAGVTERRNDLTAATAQLAAAIEQGTLLARDGSLLEIVGTVTALKACVKQLTIQDGGAVTTGNWIAVQAETNAPAFRAALRTLVAVTADAALPAKVTFEEQPAIACLPTTINMQVMDADGKQIPVADAIIVDVLDRYDTHLAVTISQTAGATVLHFTPQVSGEHRLVPSFLGQTIDGTFTIDVGANNPVATFGGQGTGEGCFRCPRAIAVGDDQCVYVADTGNRLIQKLDSDGKYVAQFRIGVASAATSSGSGSSSGGSGGVVTAQPPSSASSTNSSGVGSTVTRTTSNPNTRTPTKPLQDREKSRSTSGSNRNQAYELHKATPGFSTCDLALNRTRRVIVCAETAISESMNPTTGNTVATYSLDGCLRHRFANQSMRCALCVATNSRGDIIVSDYLVHSIFMYDRRGALLRRVGEAGGFNHPAFICVAAGDTIVVSDTYNNTVQVFDAEGVHRYQFGRLGRGKGELRQPFGVAVDGERILVADSGNARIQVFTLDGEFVSMIESVSSPLQQPRGIAVTGDGHVLVADRDNHCIKKYRYR